MHVLSVCSPVSLGRGAGTLRSAFSPSWLSLRTVEFDQHPDTVGEFPDRSLCTTKTLTDHKFDRSETRVRGMLSALPGDHDCGQTSGLVNFMGSDLDSVVSLS